MGEMHTHGCMDGYLRMDERDRRRVRARCSPDDVHGLDVAVDDAPLVEVHEAGDDAPHEGDDVVELKALLGHNLATQEASSTHWRISRTVCWCARPICWESERTCISHMQRRPVIECNHGKLSRWSARKSEWRMRARVTDEGNYREEVAVGHGHDDASDKGKVGRPQV